MARSTNVKTKTGKNYILKALKELEDRGISIEDTIEKLKEALEKSYVKYYLDSVGNCRVEIDKNFKITIHELRTVVDDVNDEDVEISIEEAQEINPNYQVGDIVETKVSPEVYGRLAATHVKTLLRQAIREKEKENVYNEYKANEYEALTGIVERVNPDGRYAIINLGKTTGYLGKMEMMPNEQLTEGQELVVYVKEVMNDTKGTKVTVSRNDVALVKRLFEREVPEFATGDLEIYAVARDAGERTKIAVLTNNPDIDPIGACIGKNGIRVTKVVGALNGEMMDIIAYDKDIKVFIEKALQPSKVISVDVDENKKSALVIVPDNQLSLAIGKKGQNARLASRLTNWGIDIKSMSDAIAMGLLEAAPEVEEEVEAVVETNDEIKTEVEEIKDVVEIEPTIDETDEEVHDDYDYEDDDDLDERLAEEEEYESYYED